MMNSNNLNTEESIPALREAAILIQFLGSQEQIDMMQKVMEVMLTGGEASLDPLLASLRDDIRDELRLGRVNSRIFWLHPNQSCKD
jgi:hypothetical protein